jgi:hypothetical protein
VYDVDAPAWVNDLTTLEFSHGYWITVTQDVVWRIRGPSYARRGGPAPGQAGSILNPPATYYGEVQAGSGFTPTAGMVVIARINGNVCGQGQTLLVGGQVVYSVKVLADGPGAPGCGAPGRTVTFEVATRTMATTTWWNNDRVWYLPLTPSLARGVGTRGSVPVTSARAPAPMLL